MVEGELLAAREAARRLGVKPETLYAYVSRGLIAPRRRRGRESYFAVGDLDALLARGRRRREAEVRVASALTLIRPDGHFYRGRDARELAVEPFEQTAEWLWGEAIEETGWQAEPAAVAAAVRAQKALPRTALPLERMPLIVAAAAAVDDLRFEASPEAARTIGRRLLPTLAAALPSAREAADPRRAVREGGGFAASLWSRLSPKRPTRRQLDVVNAALVLLADHELSASALAARVAASTRANPYAVVTAGLGVLQGPFHGGTSLWVEDLLAEVAESGDPEAALGARRRFRERIFGFGHRLYPDGDPRGRFLLERLDAVVPAARWRVVAEVMHLAAERELPPPTVDFALAALVYGLGLRRGSGEALFAIARTAGWLAHAIEEYANEAKVVRLRAVYVGPEPG